MVRYLKEARLSGMSKLDLRVNLAGVVLENPITTASGTFSAMDSSRFYDINCLGAVITKGIASQAWEGNPTPRIGETYGGMLNSVGLQNPGVDHYIENELKFLEKFNTKIIANVAGRTIEEYCQVVEKLNETCVSMFEINISCPNVKNGGIGFGTDPKMAAEVTRAVKGIARRPVIIKLTPNVTDITEIAKAVEEAGADAISLINTLLGMGIDVQRRKPVLANIMGGLSGPAVKPVALRMVYQVSRGVKIPVIGLGGISTGEDAVEFIMAGASAVSVGTAALVNPTAPVDIKEELINYMLRNGFRNIKEIREAYRG